MSVAVELQLAPGGGIVVGDRVLRLPGGEGDDALGQAVVWANEVAEAIAGAPVVLHSDGLPRAVVAALVFRFGPEVLTGVGAGDGTGAAAAPVDESDAEWASGVPSVAERPADVAADGAAPGLAPVAGAAEKPTAGVGFVAAAPVPTRGAWRDAGRKTVAAGGSEQEIARVRAAALEAYADIGPEFDAVVADETERRARRTEALSGFARCRTPDDVDAYVAQLAADPSLGLAPGKIGEKAQRRKRELQVVADARSAIVARPDVPHRLPALAPASDWALYVDETGETFSPLDDGGKPGWLVLLAVPRGLDFPSDVPLGHHSASASDGETDALVQWVLDHPVGLLGYAAAGGAGYDGVEWLEAVMQAVSIALRTLPAADGPLRVRVEVERRGAEPLDGRTVARALHLELALRDPERARRLALSVAFLRKGTSAGLVFADAIAYSRGATMPAVKDRKKRWGLEKCFLDEVAVRRVQRALDSFGQRRSPSGEAWRELMRDPDALDRSGIVGALLHALSERCRTQPRLWERYLEASRASLEDKGFDAALLARQVSWLAQAAPPGWTPTGLQALAQSIQALASGNHLGDASRDAEDGVLADAERLRAEDGRTACFAALHVAVRRTNRFAFAEATAAIDGWLRRPEGEPGLLMHGRLLSSRGQHHAFLGRSSAAEADFAAALAVFGRLSDPVVVAQEQRQTATYRAIAALDNPALRVDERRALSVAAGVSFEPGAVTAAAASTVAHERWTHHLLLRVLAEEGTGAAAGVAYLSAYPEWSVGEGHPWGLIDAWRGVLLYRVGRLADSRVAFARSLGAFRGAGGTLRLIGTVVQWAAWCAGAAGPVELAQIGELRAELPHAAGSLDALHAFAPGSDPGLVLRRTLPFNFC